MNCSAVVFLTFGRNNAIVVLHYPFGNGQSDTGAFIFLSAMQPLE